MLVVLKLQLLDYYLIYYYSLHPTTFIVYYDHNNSSIYTTITEFEFYQFFIVNDFFSPSGIAISASPANCCNCKDLKKRWSPVLNLKILSEKFQLSTDDRSWFFVSESTTARWSCCSHDNYMKTYNLNILLKTTHI